MTSGFSKGKESLLPPAFEGLTEKELTFLYRIAEIKKMNRDDSLFSEGDRDASMWFILEGSVMIKRNLDGQSRELAVLSKGDSIEAMVFKTEDHRTASAVAVEPSTIMTLNEHGLNSLSPDVQLRVHQNLNRLLSKRVNDLIERQRDLHDKNAYLISYIRDHLQTKKEDYSRSEVIQKIIKSCPRLPMYASRLATRLLDNDVSASEVVDLAKLDPSLVGMILKMVNSSYYNLQRKISNFQQAVLLLGFNQIYQMALAHGIRSIMPNTAEFQELQFHSIVISFLSFEISQVCHMPQGALQSTVGLLHDIGQSIILLLRQQHPKLRMIVDTLHHGRIGSLLLEEWNIPKIVCLALEYQHYPEFSPPAEIPAECRESVAVLHLAHLSHAYLEGRGESTTPFQDEHASLLRIPEKSTADFVNRCLRPSMKKKLDVLPEGVRRLVMASEVHSSEAEGVDSDELPIVWNI